MSQAFGGGGGYGRFSPINQVGDVEREGGIGKLNIPPGFVERHQREARSALPPAALPGAQPSPSPSAAAGTRYLTDPLIAEALRARHHDRAPAG